LIQWTLNLPIDFQGDSAFTSEYKRKEGYICVVLKVSK
jgi:hypothetical protein